MQDMQVCWFRERQRKVSSITWRSGEWAGAQPQPCRLGDRIWLAIVEVGEKENMQLNRK